MDGSHPQVCLCSATGQPDSVTTCPMGMDGNQTYCRYGPSGSPTQCIRSVVCTPPNGAAYKSAADHGCGL
jgi:hypothetical protein